MTEDSTTGRARPARPETLLETLYLALNRGFSDQRVREIVRDLEARGIPVTRLVEKVQSECGAIDAGRLRRLARGPG